MYVFNFKARQLEAKSLLREVFVNQKKVYKETGQYTGCIDELIDSETKRERYIIGFGEKTQQVFGCASITQSSDKNVFVNQDLIEAFDKSFVEANSYLAVAVGRICDDCDLDIWTVDPDHNLINVQNGLPRGKEFFAYVFMVFVS